METVSVNQFRSKMKNFVEQAASAHVPLKVTRRLHANGWRNK